MDKVYTALQNEAAKYNIELSNEMLEKLSMYRDFLSEYNQNVNLTAITEPEEVAIKHFLDSLLLLNAMENREIKELCDVGSGAGFPGVPCKIGSPSLSLTIIEPLLKRCLFLEQLSERIGEKYKVLHLRGEDAGKDVKLRESFGLVSARAVKNLRELCELCLPLVKVGGYFAPLKSGQYEEELSDAKNAIKLLGGKVKEVKTYTLPGDMERSIILIEKVSPTPAKYPRIYSKISKSPL